jgi:hypothetical protein
MLIGEKSANSRINPHCVCLYKGALSTIRASRRTSIPLHRVSRLAWIDISCVIVYLIRLCLGVFILPDHHGRRIGKRSCLKTELTFLNFLKPFALDGFDACACPWRHLHNDYIGIWRPNLVKVCAPIPPVVPQAPSNCLVCGGKKD